MVIKFINININIFMVIKIYNLMVAGPTCTIFTMSTLARVQNEITKSTRVFISLIKI